MTSITRENFFRYELEGENPHKVRLATTTTINVLNGGLGQLWRDVRFFESNDELCVLVAGDAVNTGDVRGTLPPGTTLGELFDWLDAVDWSGQRLIKRGKKW